ncbi:MAG TPA: hypothetical protein VG184_00300 [Acidimicrobiales bacterium]|jgi:hypothetical protein|nr:hypothetical protein [Acidimicrobiales bacterium]
MHRSTRRISWAVVGATALATASAACGSSSPSTAASTTTAAASINPTYSLQGICPSTIVTQTDWNPEADHSELYELAAPGGTVDNSKKTYTGELVAHGHDTGVKIQVRLGGPAIGYQPVSAQMYENSSIFLGYVSTDESVELSATQPTVALVAPRYTSPFILMWDPKQHPSFQTIADIGKTNTKVLYSSGAVYMTYLTSTGVLKSSQVDGSYDSTPSRWVAAGGSIAQQGFATAEPYTYEHELPEWDKPVKYALVASSGYNPYPEAIATKPGNVTKYAACFKKLIPDIQQAQVDYAANPGPTNALIVSLVKQYNNGWVYDSGAASYSVTTQLADHIISNAADGVMGDMDPTRVQGMISILEPIYAKLGKPVKSGLTPADIVNTSFIDKSIHLPAGTP